MFDNFNFEDINVNIEFLKLCFMSIFTYYMYLKISGNDKKKQLINIVPIICIDIIIILIRYKINYLVSILSLVFFLSLLGAKDKNSTLGFRILIITISLSINYALLLTSIILDFFVNVILGPQSDYFNFVIMIIIQMILIYRFSKIKRINHGIAYLNQKSKNNYLDIVILNISVIISFSFIIIVCSDGNASVSRSLLFIFIIFATIMFITIQKSIQLYYKQKLIIKDLTESKSELEKSKQEIQNLEKENIELSKKNHSFNHKYKSLEYKMNELLLKMETSDEISLKEGLDDLSKEIYVATQNVELSKTNIDKIDDMLKFMQAECEKYKINLNLQIIGYLYYMINNIISKEELEILIADHVKDAIIAINHCDNENKSILVKLGKIEDCYGLYIYDSGIEFCRDTLEKLGKEPVTTHINEGGSGMGFMNTFDTLRKYRASLIIDEIGKPSIDNFTKIVKFKFDGRNEYKIL